MITLIAALVIFGILVTVHEWGHFITAKKQGVRVEKFSIGFGPVLFKFTWHETQYAISLIPLGGYVKMAGESPSDENIKGESWEYMSKTPWQKIKIVSAGPLVNYIFAYIIFVFVFFVGMPVATTQIGEFVEGYPASNSVLKTGDTITKINNMPVEIWEELVREIHKVEDAKVKVEYKRDNRIYETVISAKHEELEDATGKKIGVFLLGIKPSEETIIKKYGFLYSIKMGFNKLCYLSYMTYKSLWLLITGKMSVKGSLAGPVGIVMITGKIAQQGILPLIHLMGILSAALALFNFLPIPVLDGGHILFALIELVTRRKINAKFESVVQKIGFAILIGLMIFVFYNDFVNFNIIQKITGVIQKIF